MILIIRCNSKNIIHRDLKRSALIYNIILQTQ